MGKGKLAKFADMGSYPHVFEYPYSAIANAPFPLKGRWLCGFFPTRGPIVLELGCGRGEYTVGLARKFPGKNFIGVDIKGARMWSGATESLREGLRNVAFLRTQIEFIDRFFGENEVDEIWITFPDPQMKKSNKRLVSTGFLDRYARFLRPGGLIHLKTDSPFLHTYAKALVETNGLPVVHDTTDLYGSGAGADEILQIRTYYEQQWLDRGLTIKYLCFRLPAGAAGHLQEPDIEIELDPYRSYNRSKRSGLQAHA